MQCLDRNIVLYSQDREASLQKRERALACWGQDACISAQVLAEICNVLQRKRGWGPASCQVLITSLRAAFRVFDLTGDTVDLALTLKQKHSLSQFDAQILASALVAGCDTVYSEDMQHRQQIAGRLTIINPFKPGADAA